jgi:hypothetical protein
MRIIVGQLSPQPQPASVHLLHLPEMLNKKSMQAA